MQDRSETNANEAAVTTVDGCPPLSDLSSAPIRLSQGQLTVLTTCPRKFQHTYLEQLLPPLDPDQQDRLRWGAQFHSLVQQWQLGLPVEPLAEENDQLQRWFNAFTQAAPHILELAAPSETLQRQSEHTRTLEFQGYLLTVVYDLLITSDRAAKILDWKTYPRPQNPGWLLASWQTRLYPFVLAETSSYDPADISMTYWFFQSRNGEVTEPQSFTFTYDALKHEQTRQDLTHLLTQLNIWLEQYQQGMPLPQVPLASNQCEACHFAIRCDRSLHCQQHEAVSSRNKLILGNEILPATDLMIPFDLPDLGAIEEVSL